MPEGKNYREVVMTMPVKMKQPGKYYVDKAKNKAGYSVFNEDGQEVSGGVLTEQEAKNRMEQFIKDARPIQDRKYPTYTSSHFPDIPNYVAHMRLNERQDTDGNGLFIEEIQSDRHQAARKQGYKGEVDVVAAIDKLTREQATQIIKLNERGNDTLEGDENVEDLRAIVRDYLDNEGQDETGETFRFLKNLAGTEGVPDAPFRKDWPVQLFKRALRDAVDSGKDWIGWASGETQAERYDLSKQVEKIVLLKKGSGDLILSAWGKNGNRVMDKNIKDESEIADYIGKEAAQKLANQEWGKPTPAGANDKVLEGQDLKVGGEGMKGFYDQILPKEVEKYVKKLGGKVEQSKTTSASTHKHMEPVDLPQNLQDLFMEQAEEKAKQEGLDEDANEMEFFNRVQELATDLAWDHINSDRPFADKQNKIWKVKITPEMRKTILEKGQPQAMTTQQQNTQIA